MADYDMSGALFKNNKDGNDRRPDYRGDVTIHGVKYKLSAWLKEGKNGKFMSLRAEEDGGGAQQSAPAGERPRGGGPRPVGQAVARAGGAMLDDDIPF